MASRGNLAAVVTFLAIVASSALLATASPASAHADFISSSPPPYALWNTVPGLVSVTVSEAVQPGSPTIVVTNLTGARVDDGSTQISSTDPNTFSVHLVAGLGPSVYTVTWTVVSADDGHFTAGTFYFMVTYRDGTLPGQFPQTGALVINQPISPVEVVLDAAGFVGFAAAFGGILLVALLWAPLGSSVETSDQAGPADGFRALLRFARVGALVFAAAAGGLWVDNLLRLPPSGVGGLIGSTFLLARILQVAIGIALTLLLTRVLGRTKPEDAFRELPWEFLPMIFAGFVAILLEAAASHTTSETALWPLGPVADAVHLYGAALWVGGLLAIVRVRRWLREPTPATFSRDLLAAFSRFAFLGALLVVSAGAVLAFLLVGSLSGLFGTGYGWIVLAKSSLLAPIVALGAWNRRALRREADVERPDPAAIERLGRTVRIEAVLGATVLVLAGLLVTVNPASAPQPLNPQFLLETTNGGLHGIFTMNPYPVGPGSYVFELVIYYAQNGTPFLDGGNGTLTFVRVGGNVTGVTIALEGPHDNHYFVQSAVLDAPGTWDIRATVDGPAGSPVTLAFTVTLSS